MMEAAAHLPASHTPPRLYAPFHSSADSALTSPHIVPRFKSSREAPVLSAARLSAFRWWLGSNLVPRRGGGFLRGGRWPGPSVFISEPECCGPGPAGAR